MTVKDGGLKYLQVHDDGCGIRVCTFGGIHAVMVCLPYAKLFKYTMQREDLAILCQRHTTSKLEDFSRLQELKTLGFRGEALASLSLVSHLSVLTKTKTDRHGWEATYRDGELLGEPTPSAAVQGTTVTAEDLFYNAPLRRKVLYAALCILVHFCHICLRAKYTIS